MKEPTVFGSRNGVGTAGILLAWLLGPIAWAAHLAVSYALAAWICDTGQATVLHVVTLVALAAALAGGFMGWRIWQVNRRAPADDRNGVLRFMALGAMALSAFSFAAIVAGSLPGVILTPCGTGGTP